MLVSSEDKIADSQLQKILSSIKDKDRDVIKSSFSKKAMNESDNFDKGIDYLFKIFQGKLKSWKRDKWSSGESIENGKKSLMIRSWYTVYTDKDKYLFFIIDFSEDTINPDNKGLYTLRVIKAKDKKTQFTYWQDMQIAGIYLPTGSGKK